VYDIIGGLLKEVNDAGHAHGGEWIGGHAGDEHEDEQDEDTGMNTSMHSVAPSIYSRYVGHRTSLYAARANKTCAGCNEFHVGHGFAKR
jgi:hypothetical protein